MQGLRCCSPTSDRRISTDEDLVDSAATAVASNEMDVILFHALHEAFLPSVLITTDEDRGLVAPKIQYRLVLGKRAKQPLLGSEIKEGISGRGGHDAQTLGWCWCDSRSRRVWSSIGLEIATRMELLLGRWKG